MKQETKDKIDAWIERDNDRSWWASNAFWIGGLLGLVIIWIIVLLVYVL